MTDTNLIKSKERVIDKGEVFTNFREINAMLNMVGNEARRIDSKVLEPACGNGNFVAEILNRKLVTVKQTATPKNRKTPSIKDYERLSVIAISCIYGIDIMMDNILECRKRLFAIWYDTFKKDTAKIPDNKLKSSVAFIIEHNICHIFIVHLPALPRRSKPIKKIFIQILCQHHSCIQKKE